MRLLLSLLILGTALLANANEWQQTPRPAWVKQHPQPEVALDTQQSSQYLLSDIQVDLSQPQRQVYNRFSYRVNDSVGVEEGSDLQISFNPGYQQLQLHTIELIRAGKRLNRLIEKDIRLIDDEADAENRIYTGSKQLTLFLRDVRPGDIIDYSYTLVGQNPIFADAFSYFFELGWGVSVARAEISVLAPASMPLQHRFVNLDGTLTSTTEGQLQRYQLSLRDTPVYRDEGQTPPWALAYPYLQMSSYTSWQDLASWAAQLFVVDSQPSAELSRWLEQLRQLPQKQAIEAAIGFAQNDIRYLGQSMMENSHRPYPPSTIYARRYGDCKDKTMLLITALQALGIKAEPVLVSTYHRHTLGDYLPAHNLFDHVITRFYFADQWYWVDPTRTHQSNRLEAITPAYFGAGLIAQAEQTAPTAMPALQADQHGLEMRQQIMAADYSASVIVQIETRYRGREADRIRYEVAQNGQQRMSDHYLDYYNKLYPGTERYRRAQFDDDREHNRFSVRETYLVPDFWHTNAEGMAEFELYADLIDAYLAPPEKVRRNQPLAMRAPITVVQRSELWLPEHVNFGNFSPTEQFGNDYFSMSAQVRYSPRKLVLEHTYRSKAEAVPAAATKAHIEALRNAREHLAYSQSISEVTNEPAYQAVSSLMEYIYSQQMQGRP